MAELVSTGGTPISNPVTKSKNPLEIAVYTSLASKIVHVEMMNSVSQLAYALAYSYSKDGKRGTQILLLDAKPTSTEILYEYGNVVLIDSATTYKKGDTFGGANVVEAYSNTLGQMINLPGFGRDKVMNNQGTIGFQIDYSIKGSRLDANKSRKVRASMTLEALQDMGAIYGSKMRDRLAQMLLNELMSGIDLELMSYLREKATVIDTIDFDQMYADGIYDVPGELVSRISPVVDEITATTMRPDKIFLLGSPSVVRHLVAHPSFQAIVFNEDDEVERKDNRFKRGSLCGWDVYVDASHSTIEDYLVIASSSKDDVSAASAIVGIYNKYVSPEIVHEYETGAANIYAFIQYDIKPNPLDNAENGGSSFIKMFKVKGSKTTLNPSVTEIIPALESRLPDPLAPKPAAQVVKCTVFFNANNGSGVMANVTVNQGERYVLPANKFIAPDGFEFDRWDAGKVGESVEITSSFTLRPIWKVKPAAKEFTVSFEANGGSGTMASVKVKEGESYTLPACTFTAPKDKEFDKWDAGKVGAKITITANKTIKATWKAKTTVQP